MGFNMGLHQPVDYWRWAEEMDVVSNDHYLIAEDPRELPGAGVDRRPDPRLGRAASRGC